MGYQPSLALWRLHRLSASAINIIMSPRKGTPGAELRAWRKERKLSQRAASDRLAEYNEEKRCAAQTTWAAWERDEKAPDLFFAFTLERMTNGTIPASSWATPRAKADNDDKAKAG
jgi:transcriptional regulator with XRE-family HTH domain